MKELTMSITTAEYDKIVTACRLYIDGFNERDTEKFKQAFHDDAWMFWTNENGVLRAIPLGAKVFEDWAKPGGKHDPVQLRVLSVAQMGDAAGVALAFGEDWLDYHSLVRVGGKWKIANKTATHSRRSTTPLTTGEYDKIVHTVGLYVDGVNERDMDKFKEAVHEDAWMSSVDKDGTLHTHPLTEAHFKSWAEHPDDWGWIQLRVLSVAQMGDVAQVASALGDDWLGFYSLTRVNGEWKITNKTASHASR
jgi:ketosteroid isomerase-like protein